MVLPLPADYGGHCHQGSVAGAKMIAVKTSDEEHEPVIRSMNKMLPSSLPAWPFIFVSWCLHPARTAEWLTLLPRKDQGQHLAQRGLGAGDAELVVADEQGDGLGDIAEAGAGQQLGEGAQGALHGLDKPAGHSGTQEERIKRNSVPPIYFPSLFASFISQIPSETMWLFTLLSWSQTQHSLLLGTSRSEMQMCSPFKSSFCWLSKHLPSRHDTTGIAYLRFESRAGSRQASRI